MSDTHLGLISRRGALERLGILAGGVLSASVVSGISAGCRAVPPQSGYAPQTLGEDQMKLVSTLSEMIIPTTDTPGAIDAGVPAFVDQMLTTWYPDADRANVLGGLVELESKAQQSFGSNFGDAATEQQVSLLTAMANGEPFDGPVPDILTDLFQTLKELTVVGYYTSEIGATQELRQMPMGQYRGDVPFDEIGRAWS